MAQSPCGLMASAQFQCPRVAQGQGWLLPKLSLSFVLTQHPGPHVCNLCLRPGTSDLRPRTALMATRHKFLGQCEIALRASF